MIALLLALSAHAGDWPGWGDGPGRNMVSPEKKSPVRFEPGRYVDGTEIVDPDTTRGVKWVAKLGSQTYGNPTIAGGLVMVGTNNAAERRPGITGDYSVVMAFDQRNGDLRWQLSVPKMDSGKVNDWEFLGICSAPTWADGTIYVVTTHGEVVALDPDGHADGNDGFQDEEAYMGGPGKAPVPLDPLRDADILWVFDMVEELGVFPHNATSNSVLVVGDTLYLGTSNGVDWSHVDLPSPFAPALIALDRHTGALLAEEAAGISERTLHANWSSPSFAAATQESPDQVVFGGGDGFVYGFGVEPVDDDGLAVLPKLWSTDANLPTYRVRDGAPMKYATPGDGPSEVVGSPVVHDGLIYVSIGQDPEHGGGVGLLTALTLRGDVRWRYDGLRRSISTPAVARGMVLAPDYDGVLHAVDAKTGAPLWTHDTGAHIWGSPLVVGSKLYLGNEDGILTVLKVGKKPKVLAEVQLPAPIYSSPVLADGVLYVATQTQLYAVGR